MSKNTFGLTAFLVSEINYHRVPLIILLSFAFSPRLIVVYSLFVLLWLGVEQAYRFCPTSWRKRIDTVTGPYLAPLRRSTWWADIAEAVGYTRPFLFFAIYIFCIPVSLCWMAAHWMGEVIRPGGAETAKNGAISNLQNLESDRSASLERLERLVFTQRKNKNALIQQNNFFTSPAFSITTLLIFAAGLPAFFTYNLYRFLQIDRILDYPSADPQFFIVIVIIGFYLSSLGWCVSILFFRAWFTFPLNFLSSEYELVVDSVGLRKMPCKGWFYSAVTLNNNNFGVGALKWSDIKVVQPRTATGVNLYPLPTIAFGGDTAAASNVWYRLINKCAFFYDSLTRRIDADQYLSLMPNTLVGSMGSSIDVNLSELSVAERAQLFCAIAKWGPQAEMTDLAQAALLGSSLKHDSRYTEIWFDLLTQKQERYRLANLETGASLQDGRFQIVECIAAGGQATAYLALNDDEPVVLKEFILSDADVVGAIIESARDFENEASLLSRLDHPRVVKLTNFFAEDRRAYLVLEHVRGRSLRDLIRADGPLPSEKVVEIALQVCSVLEYLHGQNPPLIHRDLSPDNIIYDPDLGIKLIDFSLATAREINSVCVGKNAYTSPEQFRDEASIRSDIYTLGATMQFLLTGADPRPLSQSSPAIIISDFDCLALSAIVEKATSLLEDERYESAAWMALDLQGIGLLGGQQISQHPRPE